MTRDEWLKLVELGKSGTHLSRVYQQEVKEDPEEDIINRVTVQQLLLRLPPRERETIALWATGVPVREIAAIISVKYDGRKPKKPITVGGMQERIIKILQTLRKIIENDENNDI